MKINNLLEGITAASSPENAESPAPHFGRSDKFLEEKDENKVEECTTSGSLVSVASPVGGMQRRGKGSIFSGIKTSDKYPNSKAVKESFNRAGYNPLRDKEDYLDKREHLHNQLNTPGLSKEDRDVIRQAILDLEFAAKKAGLTKQLDEFEMPVGQATGVAAQNDNSPRKTFSVKIVGQFTGPRKNIQAEQVWLALETILPRDYPRVPYQQQSYNEPQRRVIDDINEDGFSIVKQGINSLDIAETIASKFESKGIPAEVIDGGLYEEYDPGQSSKLIAAATKAATYIFVWKALWNSQFRTNIEQEYNITYDDLRRVGKNFPTWVSDKVKELINWIQGKGGNLTYDPANPIEFSLELPGSAPYTFNIAEMISGGELEEAKKANTKTARKAFGKRVKAKLSDKEEEKKQSESDRLWAMLQQHIADTEKEVKEGTMDYSIDPSITDFASVSIIKKLKRDVHEKRLPADPREIMRAGAELARYYNTELNLPLLAQQVLRGYSQGVAEGKYKCSCHPGDPDPDCPVHGLEPMEVGDALDVKLNEKSVSKAQFRTMAAVAHNPKFAKKVGISQKVGKEFHKADKKSDYEDLPARADEEKQRLDPKCWTGYKKQGTKMKGGVRVNNCVKVDEAELAEEMLAQQLYRDLQIFKKGDDKGIANRPKDKEIGNKPKDKDIVTKESANPAQQAAIAIAKKKEQGVKEDWQKTNKQDKTDGMSPKAVKAYRRENPGSKLQTAVTTKPSKLKAGSKDAKRRKSFCARMSGNPGPMKDEKGRPTPKAKALRRWNCE